MFTLTTLLPFFLALAALQLSPGPDMILIMARGIGQGRKVAFATAMGATLLAGMIQLPLLAFGLASLIQASPLAFDLLRWIGAGYLVWLGGKLLLQRSGDLGSAAEDIPVSIRRALREGMISNLTNPKSLVFMRARR